MKTDINAKSRLLALLNAAQIPVEEAQALLVPLSETRRLRDPRELLTISELAEYLSVSTQTVYNWRVDGEGPYGQKVGRRILFRVADVDAWLVVRANKSAGSLLPRSRSLMRPSPMRGRRLKKSAG